MDGGAVMGQPTPDQLDGVVRIHIEGKERKLRYDLRAQALLCSELTLDDISSLMLAFQDVNGDTLPLFLWAGLLWDEPDLTREEVGRWFAPLIPTARAIAEATSLAMFGPDGPPEPDDKESDSEDPPTPDTVSL